MDETTKPEDKPVAQQTSASNLIEQAKEQADRIAAENDRFESLIRRQEEANAVRMLSGTTSAGQLIKTEEDLKKEEAQKMADEISQAFR